MEKGLKELAILSFLEGKDGGGGDAPSGTKEITVTSNGTTTHDVESYKNAKIIASVPNSYAAGDEGKVVSEGELVAQGSDTVTENDTYDTTLISSLTVNVSGGSPSGTKQISISSNGTTTENVASYASAEITVAVPNSYSAGDEGKVVSNGALVAQTSDTVTQNGTVDTTLINSLTVNVSGGGVEEKDVDFYDYDGTLLNSYTAAEFANLTEFPSNPIHAGLVADGWNWTLATAKTYVAKYGALVIGQTYHTDDGAAHVHISISEGDPKAITLYLPKGWVEWGDGSARETISAAGNTSHTYAAAGDYVIKIHGDGTTKWTFDMKETNIVKSLIKEINLSEYNNDLAVNTLMEMINLSSLSIPVGITSININVLRNAINLKGLVFPKGFTTTNTDFSLPNAKCVSFPDTLTGTCKGFSSSATKLTIPDGPTSIQFGAAVRELKVLVVPDTVTSIGDTNTLRDAFNLEKIYLSSNLAELKQNFCRYIYQLKELTIPEGVDTIGYETLSYAYSLKEIVLPSTLTSIGNLAISDVFSLLELHTKATTPPTISSNTFRNMSSACVIYVPYSADHSVLATYQAATNWSSKASQMQEEVI